MRASRGKAVGWVVVVAYATLCAVVGVAAVGGTSASRGSAAGDELLAAWRRMRSSTYVAVSDFERRNEAVGAVLRSEVVVAQRPPVRVVRQLGGIDGRVGDRPLLCGAPIEGQRPRCQTGPPGRAYAETVEGELRTLRTYVTGARAIYSVVADAGCFWLRAVRRHPLAPYGRDARLCFDDRTGALREVRIDYGAVHETLRLRQVRTTVTDADLRPALEQP